MSKLTRKARGLLYRETKPSRDSTDTSSAKYKVAEEMIVFLSAKGDTFFFLECKETEADPVALSADPQWQDHPMDQVWENANGKGLACFECLDKREPCFQNDSAECVFFFFVNTLSIFFIHFCYFSNNFQTSTVEWSGKPLKPAFL